MKRGAIEHPKTEMLAAILGITLAQAVGHLEMLWHFTAKYSPDGEISRWDSAFVAKRCGWDGDPRRFIDALVNATAGTSGHGFVDRIEDVHTPCVLRVHDWPLHCDDSVHMQLARGNHLFSDGTKPSTKRLSKRERSLIEKRFKGQPPQKLRSVHTQNAQETHGERTQNALPSPPKPSQALPSQALPCITPNPQRLPEEQTGGVTETTIKPTPTDHPTGAFNPAWARQLYESYPKHRREGWGAAQRPIEDSLVEVSGRGMTPEQAFAWLMERVKTFAQSPAGNAGRFTWVPKTFFEDKHFDDSDEAWERDDGPGETSSSGKRVIKSCETDRVAADNKLHEIQKRNLEREAARQAAKVKK